MTQTCRLLLLQRATNRVLTNQRLLFLATVLGRYRRILWFWFLFWASWWSLVQIWIRIALLVQLFFILHLHLLDGLNSFSLQTCCLLFDSLFLFFVCHQGFYGRLRRYMSAIGVILVQILLFWSSLRLIIWFTFSFRNYRLLNIRTVQKWVLSAFLELFRLGCVQFDRLFILFGVFVRDELRGKKFSGSGSFLLIRMNTFGDESESLFVHNSIQWHWFCAISHFFIDLTSWGAFRVRSLLGDHFENAHSESIDVNFDVVMLVVEFRRHKVWRTQHRTGVGVVHWRRQAQISNFDLSRVRINENVVTFEVPVNYGHRLFVQVG